MYTTTPLNLNEHRDALVRIWSESMTDARMGEVAQDRIRWLYQENPSGPAQTWLGIANGTEIIGCGSIFPREMLVNGQLVKSGVLADFAVDRRHRFAGSAIAIQRAIIQGFASHGLEFVYGWPNSQSLAVVKRVGYTAIAEAWSWVKPLRSEVALSKLLEQRVPGSRVAPLAARLAAPLADYALRLNDALLGARVAALEYEILERADERFDDLWECARSPYVLGRKSRAYLNWRYADFTTARYRFFCQFERGKRRLVGYVVYSIVRDTALVADVFCEQPEKQVVPLLAGFALAARREPVRSIYLTYVGSPLLTDQLPKLGYRRRGVGRSLVVGVDRARPEAFRNTVFDPTNWFMFDGELDI